MLWPGSNDKNDKQAISFTGALGCASLKPVPTLPQGTFTMTQELNLDSNPSHQNTPSENPLAWHERDGAEPVSRTPMDSTPTGSSRMGSTQAVHRPTAHKPLPRYRRDSEAAPDLLLQERDVALLEDVWQYRWLTTSQLAALRAGDPRLPTRFTSRLPLTRRLKLLYHHRYLGRIARPLAKGSLEPVYVLDSEGAKALSRLHGEVGARAPSQLPKAAALQHLLTINQVRVALTVACQTVGYQGGSCQDQTGAAPLQTQSVLRTQLVAWHNSDAVKFATSVEGTGERSRQVKLIPDGCCVLRITLPSGATQRCFYFVEVDLGTEPLRTISDKCRAYYSYWHSGGFAAHFSLPPAVAFRVLFVAPTPKRAEAILSAIQKLPAGRALFWVTTSEHITPETILHPVWCDGATGARLSLNGKENLIP